MATTSRVNLRKELSISIADYRLLTATADGNEQKTSHVASGLANLPGGRDPDAFIEWYDFATSGANAAESKRVASYIPDTYTLLYQEAHGAQTARDDTFELHRYDPTLKNAAINIALAELFPWLYNGTPDETLMVDNLLSNSDFETFSSGFTGWTEVGSPTVTAETSRVYHGVQAAKIVAGAAAGQLTQAPTVNILEVTGKGAVFKMRAYATAGSVARIRLDWDGSNFSNSSYHSGKNQWELLEVAPSVPSTATQVKVICEVAAGGTAFFDAGWLAIDPLYRYTIPASMVRGPFQVLQQATEDDINGPYYGLRNGPTQGRVLRLTGMKVLSLPTTDTGTTEIGEPHLRLLVAYAKKVLWEMLVATSASLRRAGLLENVKLAQQEVERISRQPGIRMRPMAASRGAGSWHVESSGGTRYLVFD